MYYRGAGAAVLVYDMCKASSFQALQRWVEELRSNGPPSIALIVCGKKADLAKQHRQVDAESARTYAGSIGAAFFEASAKENWNVQNFFHEIANESLRQTEPHMMCLRAKIAEIRLIFAFPLLLIVHG